MAKVINPKKSEIINGETIKYQANGKTIWSKGKLLTENQLDIGGGIVLTEQLNVQKILRMENLLGNGQLMMTKGNHTRPPANNFQKKTTK